MSNKYQKEKSTYSFIKINFSSIKKKKITKNIQINRKFITIKYFDSNLSYYLQFDQESIWKLGF